MISETEVQKKPPVQVLLCPSVHTSYPGASITLKCKHRKHQLGQEAKHLNFIPTNTWNWCLILLQKAAASLRNDTSTIQELWQQLKKSSLHQGSGREMKLNLPTSLNNAIPDYLGTALRQYFSLIQTWRPSEWNHRIPHPSARFSLLPPWGSHSEQSSNPATRRAFPSRPHAPDKHLLSPAYPNRAGHCEVFVLQKGNRRAGWWIKGPARDHR